jgi:ORF6N domain
MFQLSPEESANLRSQTVIPSAGHGGRRTAPYAFTEQGVAMLSSVLGSPRAIANNIETMRILVRVRSLADTHGDLAKRLAELDAKTDALAMSHDSFSRNTRRPASLHRITAARFPISIFAIAFRCTSSGPSTMRTVRWCA